MKNERFEYDKIKVIIIDKLKQALDEYGLSHSHWTDKELYELWWEAIEATRK